MLRFSVLGSLFLIVGLTCPNALYSENGFADSEQGQRFLSWFEKSSVDSLDWYFDNHESQLYEEFAEIVSAVNSLHLANKTEEAELYHNFLDWIGTHYAKKSQSSYLVRYNQLCKSWSRAERLKKQKADSLGILADTGTSSSDSRITRLQTIALHREIGDSLKFVRESAESLVWGYELEDGKIMLVLFKETLRISHLVQDRKGQLLLCLKLGRLTLDIEYYRRASEVNEGLNDDVSKSKICLYYGFHYTRLGNYYLALKYYYLALDYSRKYGSRREEAKSFSSIAVVHNILGNLEAAEKYYKNALVIYGDVHDPPIEATTQLNLGALYFEEGAIRDAMSSFERAIDISKGAKEFYPLSLSQAGLAECLASVGLFNKALKQFQRAIIAASNCTSKYPLVQALNSLANYYIEIEHFRDALPYAQHTFALADGLPAQVNLSSYLNMALVYKGVDNDSLFYNYLKLAKEEITKMQSRLSHLSFGKRFYEKRKIFDIYSLLISESIKRKDYRSAYNDLRELKSHVLMDGIQTSQMEASHDSLFQELSVINNKIEKLHAGNDPLKQKNELEFENQKVELTLQRKDILQQINTKYPQQAELLNPTKKTVSQIQSKLESQKIVLLDFLVGEESTIVFVVRPDTLFGLSLPIARDSLRQLVVAANPNLKNYNVAGQAYIHSQPALVKLYENLVSPIRHHLQDYEKLVIVPDDWLAYLPFEMLINPDHESYLLEDYAVSYLPSVNLLADSKNAENEGAAQLLGFANPYFGELEENKQTPLADYVNFLRGRDSTYVFYPLTKTEEELQGIMRNVDGEAYVGKQATESIFRQQAAKADIIHIATHAVVDERMPMYSKLILAQTEDKENDGFLQTYELYNMKFNADLVVLSACQTGFGKLSRGEGLASLSHGFLRAGAASLVASLWPVEDQATAIIMELFYQGLKQGLLKDEALRQAKLKYLQQAPEGKQDPFYWAGFVLTGDNSAIQFKSSNSIFRHLGFGAIFLFIVSAVIVYKRREAFY